MFTIKLYADDGLRQRIVEAEEFTILRCPDGATEITLHRQPSSDGDSRDVRYDIGRAQLEDWPQVFDRAIIENAMGKTTEIIRGAPLSMAA